MKISLRDIIRGYIWEKVTWAFLISFIVFLACLLFNHTTWLFTLIGASGWQPPEVFKTVDKIFGILAVPALVSTILTGMSFFIKWIMNFISESF